MKITEIEVFYVAVPYIPAIRKYRPHAHTERPIPIIRVVTDEGLVGFGEGGREQRVEAEVEKWLGREPLTADLASLGQPFAGAMYDLAGKALGVPAWRLMGDQVRQRVPVSYWSTHMAPEDTAAEASAAVRQGFTSYKIKAWEPDDIVDQVRHVEAVVGSSLEMVLDPNKKFRTYAQTLRLARQLERFPFVRCLEDPFPWEQALEDYHLLRQRLDIPVAIHFGNPRDVLAAVRAGAVDVGNVSGTVDVVRRCAAIMEAAGREVWLQAVALGLGISGAFGTHLHSVIPNATLPSDSLHFVREHDLLVDDRLKPKDGMVTVPEEPGLGIEVDMEAVEAYRVE